MNHLDDLGFDHGSSDITTKAQPTGEKIYKSDFIITKTLVHQKTPSGE